MDNTKLIKKIELLPQVFQQQVMDFVEFLTDKYASQSSSTDELSDELKKELDARWADYLENPDSSISIEKIKERELKF